MLRVLVCDTDPQALQDLLQALQSVAGDWQVTGAAGNDEAIAALAEPSFDVVVADVRLSAADGRSLLSDVRQCRPGALRIGMASSADRKASLRCAGDAHQVLPKPCEARCVKEAVERAYSLRSLLKSKALANLVSEVGSLPSVPGLYAALLAKLQSPETTIGEIAEIIAGDVAMTAKMLQLVNSAFFGFRWRVDSAEQAVALLGLRTVRDLALTVQVFSEFEGLSAGDFSAESVVRHSIATGSLAKVIALAQSAGREMVSDSFLAGVLHDAGKLLLAQKLPEQYEKVLTLARQKAIPPWRAELEQFGTTHAEVGAYLLGLWALPDPVVEAVAFHHRPERSVLLRFAPLAAVHVADLLEHKIIDPAPRDARSAVSMEFLNRLDLTARIQPWEFNCQQVGRQMKRF